MAPPSLENMPPELTVLVASHIDERRDMFSWLLSCKSVYCVVASLNLQCLPSLFKRKFDLPLGKDQKSIVTELKRREFEVRWGEVTFCLGRSIGGPLWSRSHGESEHLLLARELIIQSYAGLPKPTTIIVATLSGQTQRKIVRHVSQNLKQLEHLVKTTNLIDCHKYWFPTVSFHGRPTKLLQTVWLLTLSWQLVEASSRPQSASAAYNFVFSQRAVYSHPDTRPGSLFDDGNFYQVNLKLAVNIVTFFKLYFTVRGGSAMYSFFQKLKPHQKPQAWRHQILQGAQKLGKYWKGSYAYLSEGQVDQIRTAGDSSQVIADKLDANHGFASLELDFDGKHIPWPQDYEGALESIPPAHLIEHLKHFSSDWLQPDNCGVDWSNGISDYSLEQGALDGDTEKRKELDWRRHSRTLQIRPEEYEVTKNAFWNGWKEHEPSPISRTAEVPWSLSSSSDATMGTTTLRNGKKKLSSSDATTTGNTTGNGKKKSPPPLLPSAEAGIDYHQVLGRGMDGPRFFNCAGNVHAVPPVEEIPGWQRITLIKRYEDETEWCFEGVVFPGNMIIVGRWWSKHDFASRLQVGPFIYWNIDQ